MRMSLVLVAGLLLGSGEAPKAKKDFVIPEATATITLTPGTKGKFKVLPVKTEQGYRIKLEMSDSTIEATSVFVKSEGDLYFFQIDEKDGKMSCRKFIFKAGQEVERIDLFKARPAPQKAVEK